MRLMKTLLAAFGLMLLSIGAATAQGNSCSGGGIIGMIVGGTQVGAACYYLKVNSDGSLNVTSSGGTAPTPSVLELTPTNDSISLTAGGTAQTIIPANATRKGCTIQNPATAADQGIATAENAYINFGGTAAAASTSFELLPGMSISCAPIGMGVIMSAISTVAATTGHKIIAVEYN